MTRRGLLSWTARRWSARAAVKLAGWVVVLGLVTLAMMFFIPTRNFLLSPIMPGPWRDIPTISLLKYTHLVPLEYPVGVCPAKCDVRRKPKTQRSDLDHRNIQYRMDQTVKSEPHYQALRPEWLFWPVMSRSEKLSLIHALDVFAEVLTDLGVDFFLVGGTLLGVVRHRGIIPWDDDVDVAISSKDWRKVKDALCCLQGFTLVTRDFMHWKLFQDDSVVIRTAPETRFPFVDIFFYDTDDVYIWAVTHYTRKEILCLKSDVFPLKTAELEGKSYPVPRNTDKLVRREFDLDTCVSPSHLHRFNRPLGDSDMVAMPCRDLEHMYPMKYSLEED